MARQGFWPAPRTIHFQPQIARGACPICRTPFRYDADVGFIPACRCGERGKSIFRQKGHSMLRDNGLNAPAQTTARQCNALYQAERARARYEFERIRPDLAEGPSAGVPRERDFEVDDLETDAIL